MSLDEHCYRLFEAAIKVQTTLKLAASVLNRNSLSPPAAARGLLAATASAGFAWLADEPLVISPRVYSFQVRLDIVGARLALQANLFGRIGDRPPAPVRVTTSPVAVHQQVNHQQVFHGCLEILPSYRPRSRANTWC